MAVEVAEKAPKVPLVFWVLEVAVRCSPMFMEVEDLLVS